MTRLRFAGVLSLFLALAACGQEGSPDSEDQWEPPLAFGSGTVHVATASDTVTLVVELADTPERRAFGLMDRPALGADQGMIFVYPEVQDSANGFWMFRTLVPLDIAFVDSAGSVVAIRSMEPCKSRNPEFCPSYTPGARYQSALEVNRGFFTENGVQVGSRITLTPGT